MDYIHRQPSKAPHVQICELWSMDLESVTSLKTIRQKLYVTRKVETWLPDSRVGDNNVMDPIADKQSICLHMRRADSLTPLPMWTRTWRFSRSLTVRMHQKGRHLDSLPVTPVCRMVSYADIRSGKTAPMCLSSASSDTCCQ